MPFVTAGDPSVDALPGVLQAVEKGGASLCEIGLPFSDPIADGPTIQASMTRALDAGATVDAALERVASVRAELSIGLVAMVSYSIVHRRGLARFVTDAVAAGFDGFIFPDLPLQESDAARDAVGEVGAILSQLVAPTTDPDRAAQIAAASTGFVYVVSRPGITGESAALPEDLTQRLTALRQATDTPLAVGFGVSSPAQVGQVCAVADGAIVGSAMVRQMHEAASAGDDPAVAASERALRLTAELATGLPAR